MKRSLASDNRLRLLDEPEEMDSDLVEVPVQENTFDCSMQKGVVAAHSQPQAPC